MYALVRSASNPCRCCGGRRDKASLHASRVWNMLAARRVSSASKDSRLDGYCTAPDDFAENVRLPRFRLLDGAGHHLPANERRQRLEGPALNGLLG